MITKAYFHVERYPGEYNDVWYLPISSEFFNTFTKVPNKEEDLEKLGELVYRKLKNYGILTVCDNNTWKSIKISKNNIVEVKVSNLPLLDGKSAKHAFQS